MIAVTGTNRKTTTVRLLAHIVRTAGCNVAYSSTDGVFHDGELVEAGDYSGWRRADGAGATGHRDGDPRDGPRRHPARGIGVSHNDVSVVTNISADHLGLRGVDTLDQLAEVKGTITTITRPEGWHVLNADDPRACSRCAGGPGPPVHVLPPSAAPGVAGGARRRGRALGARSRHRRAGARRIEKLVELEQVPMTLAGIASQHAHNALSASAAALAIGLPRKSVVEGLRTFLPDPESNPARANVYTLGERIVVIDYAHNEAGIEGLAEIARGLCPRAPRRGSRSAPPAIAMTRSCTGSATGQPEAPITS